MCWSIPAGYRLDTDGVMRYIGPVFEEERYLRSNESSPYIRYKWSGDTKVWKFCPRCGTEMQPEYNFCHQCGQVL